MAFPDFARVDGSRSCPCCGAPLVGPVCDYCGRALVDFACVETDKSFYLKVRLSDGRIVVYHVRLRSIDFDPAVPLYADNVAIYCQSPELLMRMDVLPE